MVSNATWIVFAQLIIFNPQGNGDENELTEFKQKEFSRIVLFEASARF